MFRSAINKRNKELHHVSKELSQSETFLSRQLPAINFYTLKQSITSYNKKSLRKSLNAQQKSYITDEKLQPTTFTSNETITSLTQSVLSQEEADLLKTGLYFFFM